MRLIYFLAKYYFAGAVGAAGLAGAGVIGASGACFNNVFICIVF